MANPINAILINETDNVATTIVELSEGECARFWLQGEMVEVAIRGKIPQYHKFALCSIHRSESVRKYGEVIGRALCDIDRGAHVHVHNISSPGRSEL